LSWDALAAAAELLGALGVIATLAYLAVQIRQNTRLLSSSLAATTRELSRQFTRRHGEPRAGDFEMEESSSRVERRPGLGGLS